MPTGYTAGILDGKIKTFKQFATQCIRAFGGAVHMRDDDWDAPYRPDKVGDYYPEQIKEINKKIEKLKKLSDKELINNRKKELIEERIRYTKIIGEKKQAELKLQEFLEQAKQYETPTPNHVGIKEFMIQQLTDTIKWDADVSYYEKEVAEVDKQLENIDPVEIRKSLMEMYQEDLERNEKRLKEEETRINERNEWSKQYFESLNNYK